MVLFFDLPSVTAKDKKEYRHFVKQLKEHGFFALQESVYSKMCANQTVADLTVADVKKFLPKEGCVMTLVITEKQFNSLQILLGSIETDVLFSDEKVVKL